jgi:hypothetical protein
MPRWLLVIPALLLVGPSRPAHASNAGAAVCIWPSGLRQPYGVVAEADSGALVVYVDTRDNGYALYAQRVDRHGKPLWTPGGVLVRTILTTTFIENMISDGAGGCLLSWNENRGASANDVIVQRVLPNGTLGYGASGLVVCNAAGDQGEAQLVAGSSGSYYVVWKDDRRGVGDSDIYAQRLTVAGTPAWTANGIAVNAAGYANAGSFGNGGLPSVASDLQGGLLVTWVPDATRIPRAQRVSSTPSLLWTANGVEFGGSSDWSPVVAPDGAGGAWISFTHYLSGPYYPYLQHVLAAGTFGFATAGIPLNMTGVGNNFSLTPVRNASGGCFVYGVGNWGTNGGYAARQEVNAGGTLLRGYGEDLGSGILESQFKDLGDAFVTTFVQTYYVPGRGRLQVQRYGYDGTALYPGSGVNPGRDEPGSYLYPAPPAGLAGGITVVPFADGRYTTPSLISLQAFGQAFDATGIPLWDDAEPPAIQSVKDAPGDQGGLVRADWNSGCADLPGSGAVVGYRVWRSVPGTLAARLAGVHALGQEGTFAFEGRTLLARASAYWEMVGEQPAARLASYALTVPTGQDSTGSSISDESFMVEAYDDSSHIWWSGALTGHSVDNLAPPALPSAAGYYGSGVTTLYWGGSSAPDLCCYDVFRGSSPGFVASDATRIGTTSDVTFPDAHAPAYYRVGARDIHGNLGPTSLVVPAGTTAVDGADSPHAWRLQAAWHREAGALALALDVPQADGGSLALFDVAGRRLWSAPFRVEGARSLTLTVTPRETPLPSGLVFVRASSASGRTLVTRAIVLR